MDVVICGLGLMSPVGLDFSQTASSVRAGICRFSESRFWSGQRQEPYVLSMLPDNVLPVPYDALGRERVSGRYKRMVSLAGAALNESIHQIDDVSGVPLFLGVPESLDARLSVWEGRFITDLVTQSGVQLDQSRSLVVPEGRASGFVALEKAVEAVQSGACKFALAGAVDTYCDAGLLAKLDAEGRIKGPGVMDGFIPGEGAGFILVGSEDVVGDTGAVPPIRIRNVKTGFEPGHLYSDEPYRGEALSDLFKAVLTGDDAPSNKVVGMGSFSFTAASSP